jgi:hypothetical protein
MALLRHVEAAAAVVTAAGRFFSEPSARVAARVNLERRQAALDARSLRAALSRKDGPAYLALLRLSEQAGRAAEDCARFHAPPPRQAQAMAARLGQAVAALKRALKTWPRPSCESELVESKKLAAEVERLYREARAAAHGEVRFVGGLKDASVVQRLSEAGDAAQEAAEALAEAVAG